VLANGKEISRGGFERFQAATRAGYSATSAAEQGYENLIKPHIAAEIAKLRKEQSERTKATAPLGADRRAPPDRHNPITPASDFENAREAPSPRCSIGMFATPRR
jgi:hypothetical protein